LEVSAVAPAVEFGSAHDARLHPPIEHDQHVVEVLERAQRAACCARRQLELVQLAHERVHRRHRRGRVEVVVERVVEVLREPCSGLLRDRFHVAAVTFDR
jgi:hypothetical protein